MLSCSSCWQTQSSALWLASKFADSILKHHCVLCFIRCSLPEIRRDPACPIHAANWLIGHGTAGLLALIPSAAWLRKNDELMCLPCARTAFQLPTLIGTAIWLYNTLEAASLGEPHCESSVLLVAQLWSVADYGLNVLAVLGGILWIIWNRCKQPRELVLPLLGTQQRLRLSCASCGDVGVDHRAGIRARQLCD